MDKFFSQSKITYPFSAAYACNEAQYDTDADDTKDTTIVDHTRLSFPVDPENEKEVGFRKGITNWFAAKGPSSEIHDEGSGVLRKGELNQFGYLMTLGAFRSQRGFRETFRQDVSDAIGGYPRGVILRYVPDPNKFHANNSPDIWNWSYDVVSIKDNNTKNFVKSATNPEPYEIGSKDEHGDVWWKFVEDRMPIGSISLLPDLTTAEYMEYRGDRETEGSDFMHCVFPDCRFFNVQDASSDTSFWFSYGDSHLGLDEDKTCNFGRGSGMAPILQGRPLVGLGTVIMAKAKEVPL